MVLSTALLIGAGISAAASLVGNYLNKKSVDSANEATKKMNEQNLAFSREQFEEQKMLNRNQWQIQAEDMRNAGLNPALASGASLTSGSYSSNQQSLQSQNYDFSGISDFATTALNAYTQKNIASAQNKTQVEVADINAKTQESIAEQQLIEERRHNEQMEQIQRDLATSSQSVDTATIEKINSEKDAVDQSFNGQFIENEKALYDLWKTFKTGMDKSDGGVIGAIMNLVRDGASGLDGAITGNDYSAFKIAYMKYLKSRK